MSVFLWLVIGLTLASIALVSIIAVLMCCKSDAEIDHKSPIDKSANAEEQKTLVPTNNEADESSLTQQNKETIV